jgi:hypothetical protein
MNEGLGALAKKVNAAIPSPWAPLAALVLVVAYVVFGPALNVPPQPLELGFLITLSTIGIEERPPKEIDSVRDATRARARVSARSDRLAACRTPHR